MIEFEYPYLAFLIFVPFLVRFLLPAVKLNAGRALKVPFIQDIKNIQNGRQTFLRSTYGVLGSLKFIFLWLIFLCVVLALMRPVEVSEPVRLENKGRDIMLVTDISTSMLEDDFVYQGRRIERIEAVRAVISDFVKNRLHDRLGLILFGTRAYEQVPLTFDRNSVLEVLSMMEAGMAGQSTSIGDAVGLALKSLSKTRTDKKNQVIILLTDGENNDGKLSFPQAIKLAKNEGIKVYTVGVGAPSFSFIDAMFGVSNSGLDEENLKKLAEETKGQYFKVTTLAELIDVYRKIDVLEEQDFEENLIYPKKELYYIPLLLAFLLALTGLIGSTLSKRRLK